MVTSRDGMKATQFISISHPGWVGTAHCSIPCSNGTFANDYDGNTGSDEIVPHFTCMEDSPGNLGMYQAWMGYSSYNSKVVAISIGANNEVVGGTANSQETEFRPGHHQYVFTIG